jgi:HEXXH motif-containing protein
LQESPAFARHPLPESLLRCLLSAGEHRNGVAALVRPLLSSRVLTVDSVVREARSRARQGDPQVHVPGLSSVDDAWELLARAQAQDAASVRAALLDPQTGLWGAQLIRRLQRACAAVPDEAVPLWVELGYLGQLAVRAAVSAGLEFTLSVPVRDGSVMLPGLGRATFAGVRTAGTAGTADAPGAAGAAGAVGRFHVADVRSTGGRVRLECLGSAVELPTDTEADAPGWEGVRRIRLGPHASLTIDDLGPYGLTETSPPPRRLDHEEWARWRRLTTDAWELLVADHPESAAALQVGLLSLMPLPRAEPLRPRSASTSDAFGCVVMSEPDAGDRNSAAVHTAVTLVHEIRHSLLNGLIFQTPVFEDCKELFHAPWRDDPRPLGGIVHGAFSFAGVTGFWRTRTRSDRNAALELAQFEFALWRQQTGQVLSALRGHSALTPVGQQLVQALGHDLAPWLVEPVAPGPLRLAGLAAGHHRSTWRTFHAEPSEPLVRRLVGSWTAGEPAGLGPCTESVVRPDPLACRLDVLALLARMRIGTPERFAALRTPPEQSASERFEALPAGAGPGDLALLDGDTETAVRLYLAELAEGPVRPAAWAGLGLALGERGDPAAAGLLADRPELVAAVFSGISAVQGGPDRDGVALDPIRLVRWLATET